jgi:hypothetical protein
LSDGRARGLPRKHTVNELLIFHYGNAMHPALRKVERLSFFAQHRAVKGNLNQLAG